MRLVGSFAQKVVRVPKAIEYSRANPVSFTPDFSQVNCTGSGFGNRLNGFPSCHFPITRLKPGVNENLDHASCANEVVDR